MPPKLSHCNLLIFLSALSSMLATLSFTSSSSSNTSLLFLLPPVICWMTSWNKCFDQGWFTMHEALQTRWCIATIRRSMLSITLRMLMKRRRPRRPTAEWEVIPRTECPGGFASLGNSVMLVWAKTIELLLFFFLKQSYFCQYAQNYLNRLKKKLFPH